MAETMMVSLGPHFDVLDCPSITLPVRFKMKANKMWYLKRRRIPCKIQIILCLQRDKQELIFAVYETLNFS